MSLQRENFEFALKYLNPSFSNVGNSAICDKSRIFLTRRKNRGRYLKNVDEISNLLNKLDFQIIDTDELSLCEQINLFSCTKFVIGLHGAGLTNLIYRQCQPLKLLEIFPPDFIHPHYFWLCHAFNYDYDAVLGEREDGDDNNSFYLDPKKLDEKIASLLRV